MDVSIIYLFNIFCLLRPLMTQLNAKCKFYPLYIYTIYIVLYNGIASNHAITKS